MILTARKTYVILSDSYGSHFLTKAMGEDMSETIPGLEYLLERILSFLDTDEYTIKVLDKAGNVVVMDLPEEMREAIDDIVQLHDDLTDYED